VFLCKSIRVCAPSTYSHCVLDRGVPHHHDHARVTFGRLAHVPLASKHMPYKSTPPCILDAHECRHYQTSVAIVEHAVDPSFRPFAQALNFASASTTKPAESFTVVRRILAVVFGFRALKHLHSQTDYLHQAARRDYSGNLGSPISHVSRRATLILHCLISLSTKVGCLVDPWDLGTSINYKVGLRSFSLHHLLSPDYTSKLGQ
jgi:hypothetical protein